jgi:hypothetical protein
MSDVPEDFVAKQVNLAAQRHGWPLISDPHLNFVTPQLKASLEVWQAKRGTRRMPARSELTLRDLKFVLPNLAFVDIVRDGARTRFKVRLAGSELDAFLGAMTGRFIDEAVPSRFAEKWTTLWQPAIDARAPLRTAGRIEFGERRCYVGETFYAPLAADGETPDILMVATYFHLHDEQDAKPGDISARLMAELGERALLATA